MDGAAEDDDDDPCRTEGGKNCSIYAEKSADAEGQFHRAYVNPDEGDDGSEGEITFELVDAERGDCDDADVETGAKDRFVELIKADEGW